MKPHTLILFCIFMLSFTFGMAQKKESRIERRAKQRAQYKVDQKVDRTVDEAVDNVFNGLFKKKKKKTTIDQQESIPATVPASDDTEEVYEEAEAERQAQEALAKMFGNDTGEAWEPIQNNSPISFDMSITSEKKGETTTSNIKYTFDTWLLGIQFQQEGELEKMLLIMDNQKGSMTTVIEEDGKRKGYRMKRNKINTDAFAGSTETSDFKITATGNTKMIDGYFCREYLIESNSGTTKAWLTKEIQANFDQIFNSLSMPTKVKANPQDNPLFLYREYGVLIEANSTMDDGEGPEIIHTKITNIKTGAQIDQRILDISDAEIMGIGN